MAIECWIGLWVAQVVDGLGVSPSAMDWKIVWMFENAFPNGGDVVVHSLDVWEMAVLLVETLAAC